MAEEINAVEVDRVTKKFKVYYDKGHTLKERAVNRRRNSYEEREVLKGISFQIKKGEAVGLIGQNGCGKSTALKLLTRIIYPDSGTVTVRGRVSSLLELGAGFHPDMSGRENIYINASIFGLNKKEIDQRLEDIIEFSELRDYIDNPVRTYSSGMYMRLAFSVAVNVDADILLVDEILAVGDVNFQAKCFHRMMEIKGGGTTIVLVSHSAGQIERICDRSLWLQDGAIRLEGLPADVNREYTDYMQEQRNLPQKLKKEKRAVQENPQGCVSLGQVFLSDMDGRRKKVFQRGDTLALLAELDAAVQIKDYCLELNVVRADGLFCYGCSTAMDGVTCDAWEGKKKVEIVFHKMNLLAGKYHFDIHLVDADGKTLFFGGNIAAFEINTYVPERGIVYLEHDWAERQA